MTEENRDRMPSGRLPRTNLVDLVIQRVEEWIRSGELNSGDRLPSTQRMVEDFGVSRSVVREALAKLDALGVVEIRHGKGAYVSQLAENVLLGQLIRLGDYDESRLLPFVWEARKIIETEVARIAARRRTEEDVENLERALQDMERQVEAGQLGITADEAFHMIITQASQNPVLVKMVLGISGMLRDSRRASLEPIERRKISIQEHRQILRAIEEQDESGAKLAMQTHIENNEVFSSLEKDYIEGNQRRKEPKQPDL
jgi:GntR family transcriptional repressor for pyruvate dehydrogenase complex